MNRLARKNEIEEVLADYHPSDKVKELANSSRLVMLAGVTSSGRNTIIRELLKSGNFHFLVSDTTREPRSNDGKTEQDGVDYHFKTEEEFLKRIDLGLYLEAAIVHGQQLSGIGIEELVTATSQHEIGITDVESKGANSVLNVAPGTLAVFLIPPSYEEWMDRLTKRGKLDQEEIQRRLVSAEKELEEAIESDSYVILVNNNYVDTARDVLNLVFGSDTSQNIGENKKVAWHLINELKRVLSS